MKKGFIKAGLFSVLVCWMVALVWACSSDFTQPPLNSTIDCSPVSATATAPASTSATVRITATVKNDTLAVNNAAVTIFSDRGSFFDITGVAFPPAPQYFVQTGSQGFLQVDFVCPTGPNIGDTTICTATFDIGAKNCSTVFTVDAGT